MLVGVDPTVSKEERKSIAFLVLAIYLRGRQIHHPRGDMIIIINCYSHDNRLKKKMIDN